MLKATIYVDGKAYQGEDPDATYRTNSHALGASFHNHHGSELSVLKFGDTPHVIQGGMNLKSHIDRITRRIGTGDIAARRIVIELEDAR